MFLLLQQGLKSAVQQGFEIPFQQVETSVVTQNFQQVNDELSVTYEGFQRSQGSLPPLSFCLVYLNFAVTAFAISC